MGMLEKAVLKANKKQKKVRDIRRLNTLENKVETLENSIKEELYKEFMRKLGEPLECERLRKENKKLRKQVKILKEIIKEGK